MGTWVRSDAAAAATPVTIVATPTSVTFSGDGVAAFGISGTFCATSLASDSTVTHNELTLAPNLGSPAPDACVLISVKPLAYPAPLMTLAVGLSAGALDCLTDMPAASSGAASVGTFAMVVPPDPDAATPNALIAVVVIMAIAMIGSSMYNRRAILEIAGGKLKLAGA